MARRVYGQNRAPGTKSVSSYPDRRTAALRTSASPVILHLSVSTRMVPRSCASRSGWEGSLMAELAVIRTMARIAMRHIRLLPITALLSSRHLIAMARGARYGRHAHTFFGACPWLRKVAFTIRLGTGRQPETVTWSSPLKYILIIAAVL